MKTIYVTGDRSVDPMSAVAGTANLLNYILYKEESDGSDITFVTGDAPRGIEKAMRYLAEAPGVLTVYDRKMTDEGRPDFDEFHNRLASSVDAVYILHTAPLESSITKSIMRVFPEDKVHLPLQEMQSEDASTEKLED